jgi:benzoyl-CoA reductase/2-hydroxyglutaryl-CoA dehydratase subunit BcrC/BadD/HgdB
MGKKERLEELKAKLEELKSRDPSHCSGKEGFVGHTGHSMSPELFQQIEALEEEIKKLKEELKPH